MKIRAQAGAKVFFFGEYAALLGGSAGLISFSPGYQFEVDFQAQSSFLVQGLHEQSPSVKYLKQQVEIEKLPPGLYSFSNSKEGLKGFGSSTVEYLSALAIEKEILTKHPLNETGVQPGFAVQGWKSRIPITFDVSILKTYRELAAVGENPPSGYDLISQHAGGLQVIRQGAIDSTKTEQFRQILSQHPVGIFQTGRKLVTHEAIRNLDSSPLEKIKISAENCWNSLSNTKKFWNSMQDFTQSLQELGWTQKESLDVLTKIRQDSRVLFTKACGAMGADSVIIVLKEESDFKDFEKLGLKYVGSGNDLAPSFFYERLA